MTVRLRAQDEPAKTRVDYWQHVVESSLAAYRLRASGDTLDGDIRMTQFGPLTVMDFHVTCMEAIRTPELIRKSDQELCKVDLGMRGRGRFEQDGRQNVLAPGEFHLIDFRRPSHVTIESQEVSVAIFPRALLPVRDRDLRELTSVRFGADSAYASLVASMGQEVTRNLDSYDDAADPRIGTAFLDLLAVAVATRAGRVESVPAESREQAMLARVQAFIRRHLADPGLSPAMIADAHHMSVRALYQLYRGEEQTVAASIRLQRLERCREELIDARRDRPVGAVGARWGFSDATSFSRAFRAVYGIPPGEYRALYRPAGLPPA